MKKNMRSDGFSFSVNGVLTKIDFPCIMGILNLTSDSFYSGSRLTDEFQMLKKAEEMIAQGASILDIGAVSTRPNSKAPDGHYEIMTIKNAVSALRKAFPNTLLSVDTFRSAVAHVAANEGASIINDISGGTMDEKMFATVADAKLPYIMMHIQGTPENMQKNPHYGNVVIDVNSYFSQRIHMATSAGIHDIIIDPGFGFGKTIEHNFQLLNKLETLKEHNRVILVGLSRKSMIYKTLQITPDEALCGTIALQTIALIKGAHILRVHDVKEASNLILLMRNLGSNNP
jgi:dihydropteroate synthase